MPQALDVNREAVRVLATAVGVREAARQMGLKEVTVKQWSAREGWFRDVTDPVTGAVTSPVKPPTVQKQIVSGVTAPSVAMGNSLQTLGEKTRIGLARTVYRGAQASRLLPGSQVLDRAAQLKSLADTADKLHGWSKASESQALVQINIAQGQHREAPVVDLEGL